MRRKYIQGCNFFLFPGPLGTGFGNYGGPKPKNGDGRGLAIDDSKKTFCGILWTP